MRGRKGRTSEDVRFERRVLAAYGPLCERFFYARLVDVTRQNWDRTSRQAAIRNLVETQPLYLQPESVSNRSAILMVNANGRGVGQLDPSTAETISGSLREGREWHAHVRRIDHSGEQGCDVIVMLLLMVTPEGYARLVQDRKVLTNGELVLSSAFIGEHVGRDFSVEWTLVAILLLGVAITML